MPTPRRCPSCLNERDPRKYLCRTCWNNLPNAARRALNRRDDTGKAMARLRQLYDQIDNGVPPTEIRITEPTPETQ